MPEHQKAGPIDLVVQKLVHRSRGTFRCLAAYRLGSSGFLFVVDCGRCLKVLNIPMSNVTDKLVAKFEKALPNLTVLDINDSLKITSKGLKLFGENCKSLVHLRRNMPPPEWDCLKPIDDQEATVIADTMLGLHHLELCFGQFSDLGLDAILTNCKALTHLDIQGCWSVKLEYA